jgi:hypothetical protein
MSHWHPAKEVFFASKSQLYPLLCCLIAPLFITPATRQMYYAPNFVFIVTKNYCFKALGTQETNQH